MSNEQNINLSQISAIVNVIHIAQKRGAYSLQEAAQLSEPVSTITALLESLAKQQQQQQAAKTEQASTTEQASEDNNIKTI